MGARGAIDLHPLTLVITEQDLNRNMLDNVPLATSRRRRRRQLEEPLATRPLNDPFIQFGKACRANRLLASRCLRCC